MVNRRGFLFFLGAGAAGLWLAGSGVVTLSRRFVLELAGKCSFCGRNHAETGAILGVRGHPTRICDECIGLCMHIVAEERGPRSPLPPPSRELPADDELARLLAHLRDSRDEHALAEINRHLAGIGAPRRSEFACSFCDAPRREVWQLISGPGVFICDRCVDDAAAVVSGVLRTS